MTSGQERRNPSQVDEQQQQQGNLTHPAQHLGAPGTTGAAGTTDLLGAPASTGAYDITYPQVGMTQGGGQQQQHRPTGGIDEQYLSGGGGDERHDGTGLTGGAGGYDTGFGGGRQTEGGGTTMGDLLGRVDGGDGGGGGRDGVKEGYAATDGKGRTDLTGGTTGEYGAGERKHTTGYGSAGTGVGGGGTDYGTGMLGSEGMPADRGSGGVSGERMMNETTTMPGKKTGLEGDVGGCHEHREGEKKGLMGKIKEHIPGTTESGETR